MQKKKVIRKLTDMLSPYRNFIFNYDISYDEQIKKKYKDRSASVFNAANFGTILWISFNAFNLGCMFGTIHSVLTTFVFLLYFEINLFILLYHIRRKSIPSIETIERYIYQLFKNEKEVIMRGKLILFGYPILQLIFFFFATIYIPYHRVTALYFIENHFKWVFYVMLLSIFIYFVLLTLFLFVFKNPLKRRNTKNLH